MATSSGKARLVGYLEDVRERVDNLAPAEDELRVKIAPPVVKSIRRLLTGAPEDLVAGARGVLTDAGILPSYEVTLDGFLQALQNLLELVSGREAEPDGEAEDEASPEDDITPSDEELQTFAAVVARLWTIDAPFRLQEGEDFKLNLQSRAAALDSLVDRCEDPFFESVDEEKLMAMPCTKSFMALLDNYERDGDEDEIVTKVEQREMDRFLRELMRTPHMRYAHKVLVAWGSASPDPARFAAKVFDIWFSTYSTSGRRGPKSSSGFEHVCVGEEKTDRDTGRASITGFHNWIRFWSQERAGNVDYRGYVGAAERGESRVVSVRFAWDDDDPETELKPVSTFLIGTSVAFEFAMFTIAFLGYGGECKQNGIWFGEEAGPVKITTYQWNTSLGSVLRSAFVEG